MTHMHSISWLKNISFFYKPNSLFTSLRTKKYSQGLGNHTFIMLPKFTYLPSNAQQHPMLLVLKQRQQYINMYQAVFQLLGNFVQFSTNVRGNWHNFWIRKFYITAVTTRINWQASNQRHFQAKCEKCSNFIYHSDYLMHVHAKHDTNNHYLKQTNI